jgi:hypothetical protein
MKSFLTLAATALTTAALSLPATAAGSLGCSQGDPYASINATQCGVSAGQKTMRSSSAKATKAKAYAPKKHASKTKQRPTTRSGPYQGTSDEPGL